jgi:hypothetical protein
VRVQGRGRREGGAGGGGRGGGHHKAGVRNACLVATLCGWCRMELHTQEVPSLCHKLEASRKHGIACAHDMLWLHSLCHYRCLCGGCTKFAASPLLLLPLLSVGVLAWCLLLLVQWTTTSL